MPKALLRKRNLQILMQKAARAAAFLLFPDHFGVVRKALRQMNSGAEVSPRTGINCNQSSLSPAGVSGTAPTRGRSSISARPVAM